MNSKLLLPSILFASLLAISLNATAQDASADGAAEGAAHASVPTEQLANRYAELIGSTEAAAELVQQLRVDAETGAAMGYGEIDMALALAGALVDSGAAADADAALDTVLQLHADGMGWGEIAQELGFNLGQVISTAHRVDAAGQAGGNAEAGLAIAENAKNGASGGNSGNAGASTAGSAQLQADVGRGIAADAKVNARVDAGIRGSTSGRPTGVGAPVLPQRVQAPPRPDLLRPGR